MPQVCATTRSRLVSNENETNNGIMRMTRAMTAALKADELAMPTKQLEKKVAMNGNQAVERKRTALGDVSNVAKVDGVEKKKGGKTGTTKTPANRVMKNTTLTRANGHAALAAKQSKQSKKPVAKTTRSGSGAGSIAATPKRKASSATISGEASTTPEGAVVKPGPVAERASESKAIGLIHIPVVNDVDTDDLDEPALQIRPEPEVTRLVYPPGVKDIDSQEIDDPFMVAEYSSDIFAYLRELEQKTLPNPDYMSYQYDLDWKARGVLIDWLIEVHEMFNLLPETLFLTVNIIDRFLTLKIIQLHHLQLVGLTAMFIATKYEEVLTPHARNFANVSGGIYTEQVILSAERFILGTLGYDLSYPNSIGFLRRISKADDYDLESRTVAKYLLELSLVDHRFMSFRPSHVAAAAMYLGRTALGHGAWDPTLEYYAGYSGAEIEPVVQLMVDYLARPIVHEGFFNKWSDLKYITASSIMHAWAKENADLLGIYDSDVSLYDLI